MKRAQTPEDAIFAIVFILILAIGGIISVYWYNQFYTNVAATDVINNTAAMQAFAAGNTVNASWDWLILVVLIGFAISVVVVGFFIDVHSVFMPIYIIGILVGVGLAIIFQHVWNTISDNAVFSAIKASHFPITTHIMNNFGMYFIIIAILAFIATFAKVGGDASA